MVVLNPIPPISVILTVRNDVVGTRELLDALVGQTRRPDEIVVVDGGSTDGTPALLAAFDSAGIPFRWIQGAGLNIAAGRNLAITEARYEIIACTDAGCIPDSTWLEELAAPFADPAVSVVGGGYRVSARSALERVVGLLTMPGELAPIDPVRFNPSARSLAFRRAAWLRAGSFPTWLATAEDTLFACKLRRNREIYVLADNAIVRWRPRSTWHGVWRQFRNYARGEAHIGRGEGSAQFWKRRYGLAGAAAFVAVVAAALGGAGLAVLGLLLALTAVVGPIHGRARTVARRTSRWGDYFRALAVNHWVTLAGLRGRSLGSRDMARDPHQFLANLRAYWGTSPVTDCPPWNMAHPPIPRTLIVSWHWPPTRRASTQVLANLFGAAPAGVFEVLTRAMPAGERDPLNEPNIPAHRVPWMLPDDRERTLLTWVASLATTWRMIAKARRLQRDAPFQRVLGIYPHRYSLLAAWLIARTSNVPFVAYMHDLCAEALITRSRAKAAFWTFVDRHALRSAFLIAVPTREFALHYRSREAMESWVLPHCRPTPAPPPPSAPPPADAQLRMLYAGNIYQAHEDAIAALLAAVETVDGVTVEFLCPPNRVVPADRVRWVDRAEVQAELQASDVLVVALSVNSPYPREIAGCFPSKIVDYLMAGKPILAIVPAGSFVDRLVRTTGCGVAVTSQIPQDIARALVGLRENPLRAEMGAAAHRLAAQLDATVWMEQFGQRLALGAPTDPSSPPFPESATHAPPRAETPVAQRA